MEKNMSDDDRRSAHVMAPDEASGGLLGARRKLAIACVLAAMVLVVLSAAATQVALPQLARALHVTPAASVRVITAYQMALVMALLPCAALGESLGYRRVFSAGVALFSAASVACTLAPTLAWLVAARIAQGLGGAAVMALGVALLRFTVSPKQLAAAIGWNALTVALSTAAGPTLGALILSHASWPWLFAVNLPIAAAVLGAARALPQVHGSGRALDLTSVLLNAATFASLVSGIELLVKQPVMAALLLGAAAFSLGLLVRRELPKASPLVPLDLLRARPFRTAVVASVCCFTGQTLALIALPFHLQQGFGLDALETGLMITPWPLCVAILAPIAGRLSNRVSTAWLCAAGGMCLALGLSALALTPTQCDPRVLVPFLALCGAGFGLFQVPNNRTLLLAAPPARSGAAGAMQGTARLMGQTLGAVLMSVLFTLTAAPLAPRLALGGGALLTLLAGLVSTLRTPFTPWPCRAPTRLLLQAHSAARRWHRTLAGRALRAPASVPTRYV
jgi:MFS transporter, DHA2 family, multidrug resistance protein